MVDSQTGVHGPHVQFLVNRDLQVAPQPELAAVPTQNQSMTGNNAQEMLLKPFPARRPSSVQVRKSFCVNLAVTLLAWVFLEKT